jgi:tRNA nucleotidyltransferase (CCA-adding enzyme)
MTAAIRVHINLRFEGKPLGAADGGMLQAVLREVEVECLPSDIPEEIVLLRNIFLSHGFDIRFVGGCVRDAYLNEAHGYSYHHIADVDLSTNATPDQAMEIYKTYHYRYIETGLQHGTVTVLIDDKDGDTNKFEITSLRIDAKTDGRHADVAWTSDWTLDAARRDLRMNSMSLTFDDQLIDPFGGVQDLLNVNLEFVGDPDERIREDYLRILRWFRFFIRFSSGTYYYPMNSPNWGKYQATLSAIKKNAAGLRQISAERVWSEFKKMFVNKEMTSSTATHLLKHLQEVGVLSAITKVSFDLKDFSLAGIHNYHFRSINGVLMFLTLVLDDKTKLEQLAQEWRWSNSELKYVQFLIDHKETQKDALELLLIDNIPVEWIHELVRYRQELACMRPGPLKNIPSPPNSNHINRCKDQKCPVTGADLKAMGWSDGPGLGAALTQIKQQWVKLIQADLAAPNWYAIEKIGKDYKDQLLTYAQQLTIN